LALASVFYLASTCPAGAKEGKESQEPPPARKILFDTDPGGDDVYALLWLQSLARQGHAEIVAVTTVGGNVNEKLTFINASKVLALGGFGHVEVGRAAPVEEKSEIEARKSARENATDAEHIHGADGMGNLSRTLPDAPHVFQGARRSDEIIIEKLGSAPGEITLVAVGPLTNLAAAEKRSPGILARAREVVIMGGAFRREGNISSRAEFNIHFDPEAAQRVFASRQDIVVLPLDVTQQITFPVELAEEIRQERPKSPVAGFLASLCEFLSKTSLRYRDVEGLHGFHVHDAATLAYLFYPETLQMRRGMVRVETEGEWTRGQTLFDDRHGAKREANAWIALEVDTVNLLAILAEDLKVLGESR